MNFLFCYIKVHASVLNFEWIFYLHMILQHQAVVIWKVYVYWIMQIFQMLTHFITEY